MATNDNPEHLQDDNSSEQHKIPHSNERVPGQGNSNDGLTRRLGSDVESRGLLEQEKLKKGEGNGEQDRPREGSQGASRGQKTD